MKSPVHYQKGLRQLQEMYKRLTAEEIAELRSNPQEVSEELKKLRKLAAKKVLQRRGVQFPQM